MDKKIIKFLYKYVLSRAMIKSYSVTPAFNGIYYNSGQIVASNTRVLIAVNLAYDTTLEGRVIAQKGNDIPDDYPDYEKVISQSAQKEYENLAGFLTACKNLKRSTTQSILCVTVDRISLDPSLVLELVELFHLIGEDFKLYIQSNAHTRIRSESCIILVAPFVNVEKVNNVPVEDAIAYGELL